MVRNASILRFATVLVLAGVAGGSAAAQSGEAGAGQEHGRGSFQVGYIGLDLGALNSRLVATGYPRLKGEFLTLGGGGYGSKGHLVFGGEGHALVGQNVTTTGGAYDVTIGGGYGMVRVGYDAVSHESYEITPSLGLGGGAMQIEIRGRSAPTFSQVLTDPGRSSRLSTGGFLMDLGVAAEYRFHVREQKDGRIGGPMMGLSTGYVFSPGTGNWTLDNINTAAEGPKLDIEGLYVRLSLGGWGHRVR